MARRTRCHKHEDMLTEGRCPRCELETVREENKNLLEALAKYGDPIRVEIKYCPGRELLAKVLKVMAIPSSLAAWNRFDEPLDKVVIGVGARSSGAKFIVPRKIAEEAASVAEAIQDAHDEMYKDAFSEAVDRVRYGVRTIIERLESIHLKKALIAGKKAEKLAESWHKTSAFEGAIEKAIDASTSIDDLWEKDDDT